MEKHKKSLMILGGVLAGVLLVALGAFILNPQGGVYKGALDTDTKLVDDVTRDGDLSIAEPEEEFPILLKPKDEDVTGEEIVGEIEEITNTETNTTIDTTTDTDPVILTAADDKADTTTKESTDETVLFVESDRTDTTKESTTADDPFVAELYLNIIQPIISNPKEWPTSLPIIFGYDPNTGTNGYESAYEVLHFDVTAHGSPYKQKGDIYLQAFYVDYKYCLGDGNFHPISTPSLFLDGVKIATDYNQDGIFYMNEFDSAYTGKLPVPISSNLGAFSVKHFSIGMNADSAICTPGSRGRVVVKDILWSDANGEYYLYDPAIPNELVDYDAASFDNFTVLY